MSEVPRGGNPLSSLKCRLVPEAAVSTRTSSPTFLPWWCSSDLLPPQFMSRCQQRPCIGVLQQGGGKACEKLLRTSFWSEHSPLLLLQR